MFAWAKLSPAARFRKRRFASGPAAEVPFLLLLDPVINVNSALHVTPASPVGQASSTDAVPPLVFCEFEALAGKAKFSSTQATLSIWPADCSNPP